jgi:membrane protein implicated in regulation of membrane protease activity
MPNWLIWALLSAVLAIGELTSPGFFFLATLALGAISAALSGLLGLGLALQLVLFVAVSSASLVLLRPLALRHLRIPSAIRTGSAALVGKRAIVVARVDAQGGRVKIGRDEWSARAYLAGDVFQPGTRVEVVQIDGVTALVY